MSEPQPEMSTAGVIIADRTETASGKVVTAIMSGIGASGETSTPPKLSQACAETTARQLSVSSTAANMDHKKLLALAKKNAAKSASSSAVPKGFGKKYDPVLADDPTDEATIKERESSRKFFAEMKKRDF